MLGSPLAGPAHTSGILPDRPTRTAKEQAEPERAVATATKAQTVASGRAIDDGKRTILPGLRELMKLACGAVCDLDVGVVLERVVGEGIECEAILGLVAKRDQAVLSARTPAIEREHDWTGTSR